MNPLLLETNRHALTAKDSPPSHAMLAKKEGYLHPPTREGQQRLKQILSRFVVVRGLLKEGRPAEFGFSLKDFTSYFASKFFPAEFSLVGSSASFVVQNKKRRDLSDYDFRISPISCYRAETIHALVSHFFHPLISIECGEKHIAPNGMSISYKLGAIDLNFRSLRDRPILSVNATDGFEVLLPSGGFRCVDQTQFLEQQGVNQALLDGANLHYPIHDEERLRYIELRVLDKLTRGYTVSPQSYFTHFLTRLQRDYCLSRPRAGWVGRKFFRTDFSKYLQRFSGTEAAFLLNMFAITGVGDIGFTQEAVNCSKEQSWSLLFTFSQEYLEEILLFIQMVVFCNRKPGKEAFARLRPVAGSFCLLLWKKGRPISPQERAKYFSANIDVISRLCLKDSRVFPALKRLLAELGVPCGSLTFAQIEEWWRELKVFIPVTSRQKIPLCKQEEEKKSSVLNEALTASQTHTQPVCLPSDQTKTLSPGILMQPLKSPWINPQKQKPQTLPPYLRQDQVHVFSQQWSRHLKKAPHQEAAFFEEKARVLIRSAANTHLSFSLVTDILQKHLLEVLSTRLWTRRQEDTLLKQLFLAHFSSKRCYVENGSWLKILEGRCAFYARCPDRRPYAFWMACTQKVQGAVVSWMGLRKGRFIDGPENLSPLQRQAWALRCIVQNAPLDSERPFYTLLPFCHSLQGRSARDAACLLDLGRCWQARHLVGEKTADERLIFHVAMLQLILHCSQQKRTTMRGTGWRLQTLLPAPLQEWKGEISPIYLAKFSAQANYLLRKRQEDALHVLFLETLRVVEKECLSTFQLLARPVLEIMDKRLQPHIPTVPVECSHLLLSLNERISYYVLFPDLLKKRVDPIHRFVLQHFFEMEEDVELLFSLLEQIPSDWAKEQKIELIKKVGGWPLLPRSIRLLNTIQGRIHQEAKRVFIEYFYKDWDVILHTYHKLSHDFILAALDRQDPGFAVLFMEQLHDCILQVLQHCVTELDQAQKSKNTAEIFQKASPIWRVINLFYDRYTTVFSIAQIIERIPRFYYPVSHSMKKSASMSEVAERLQKDSQLKVIKQALQLPHLDQDARFVREAVRFYQIADRPMSQGKKHAARIAIEIYRLYCIQVQACTFGRQELEEAIAPRIRLGSRGLLESFQRSQLKEEEQEVLEINRTYWPRKIQEYDLPPVSQEITGGRPAMRFVEGKKGFRRKAAVYNMHPVQKATQLRHS